MMATAIVDDDDGGSGGGGSAKAWMAMERQGEIEW